MTTILGLSGSLRAGSFNSGVLRAAAAAMPEESRLLIGSIAEVPLYNADVESADGPPAAVRDLQQALEASDGLLLVTPEYNNGIPGVFKNAIDWMGSGPGAALFADKPVAVIGASPGGFGTVLAQNQWMTVLRALRARQWHGDRLMISKARGLFDPDTKPQADLVDNDTRERLVAFMAGFVASIRAG